MKHQIPTPPNEWLYKEESESVRLWAQAVDLPDSLPYWAECTNAEKEEWEHEHPQPEPDPDHEPNE